MSNGRVSIDQYAGSGRKELPQLMPAKSKEVAGQLIHKPASTSGKHAGQRVPVQLHPVVARGVHAVYVMLCTTQLAESCQASGRMDGVKGRMDGMKGSIHHLTLPTALSM